METQYNVLNYRIDLYLQDYKLAIEIDEKRHRSRNIDCNVPAPARLTECLGLLIWF